MATSNTGVEDILGDDGSDIAWSDDEHDHLDHLYDDTPERAAAAPNPHNEESTAEEQASTNDGLTTEPLADEEHREESEKVAAHTDAQEEPEPQVTDSELEASATYDALNEPVIAGKVPDDNSSDNDGEHQASNEPATAAAVADDNISDDSDDHAQPRVRQDSAAVVKSQSAPPPAAVSPVNGPTAARSPTAASHSSMKRTKSTKDTFFGLYPDEDVTARNARREALQEAAMIKAEVVSNERHHARPPVPSQHKRLSRSPLRTKGPAVEDFMHEIDAVSVDSGSEASQASEDHLSRSMRFPKRQLHPLSPQRMTRSIAHLPRSHSKVAGDWFGTYNDLRKAQNQEVRREFSRPRTPMNSEGKAAFNCSNIVGTGGVLNLRGGDSFVLRDAHSRAEVASTSQLQTYEPGKPTQPVPDPSQGKDWFGATPTAAARARKEKLVQQYNQPRQLVTRRYAYLDPEMYERLNAQDEYYEMKMDRQREEEQKRKQRQEDFRTTQRARKSGAWLQHRIREQETAAMHQALEESYAEWKKEKEFQDKLKAKQREEEQRERELRKAERLRQLRQRERLLKKSVFTTQEEQATDRQWRKQSEEAQKAQRKRELQDRMQSRKDFAEARRQTSQAVEHQLSPMHVAVNDRVVTVRTGVPGTVRFVGTTSFSAGVWVGVELDRPAGKHNGEVQGVKYFDCKDKYGVFVRPAALIIQT